MILVPSLHSKESLRAMNTPNETRKFQALNSLAKTCRIKVWNGLFDDEKENENVFERFEKFNWRSWIKHYQAITLHSDFRILLNWIIWEPFKKDERRDCFGDVSV